MEIRRLKKYFLVIAGVIFHRAAHSKVFNILLKKSVNNYGGMTMSFDLSIDRESPFQPGKPVSPHYFKGRQSSIQKILRYYNKACHKDVQHFFLTGKKASGKTSLADFVMQYLENYGNALGIYVSNKGKNSLKDLVTSIFEAFLNKVEKGFFERNFEGLFGTIENVEFTDAHIHFRPDEETSGNLVDTFHYILNELINKEFADYDCVFLVIDDINDLSAQSEFVNWYKRFADTIEVDNSFNLPLYILFTSYPEKFDSLVLEELAFGRIFHYEEIGSLEDSEVREFFIDTFDSAGMKCKQDALELLVLFSQGSPLMMQQIGDAVFWKSNEEIITKKTATIGVLNAANEVGNKQIRPDLNRIKSQQFLNILLKLGKNQIYSFKKSELEYYLSYDEKNVLNEFLAEMIEIGILNSTGMKNSIEYKFSNIVYLSYFMIKAELT